ncbi:MAG: hypothetical protein KA153_10215 [Hyphomonadaceae bacterium]|nr:hypothetical protein [Hyphomonadaceae bacterium]
MDIEDIAKWLGGQFTVIAQAPLVYIATIAAVSFAIWRIVEWHFKTRLENSSSTIALLNERLQDYKDKLSGATPDEARARMDALESRIEALGPKRIGGDQKREMIPHLDPFRGTGVIITADGVSADAAGMSPGLKAAFSMAGWHVTSGTVLGIGRAPPTGVGMTVEDTKNLTPQQKAIVSALNAANIKFDLMQGSLAGMAHPSRPTTVAEILLTTAAVD